MGLAREWLCSVVMGEDLVKGHASGVNRPRRGDIRTQSLMIQGSDGVKETRRMCVVISIAARGMRVRGCMDKFAVTLARKHKDLRRTKKQKDITQIL
jgi:mannitol/fructose-specific phosphotransferase system IIA component